MNKEELKEKILKENFFDLFDELEYAEYNDADKRIDKIAEIKKRLFKEDLKSCKVERESFKEKEKKITNEFNELFKEDLK